MLIENINKFPIVVIGPPRSGSSVVCAQVGTDYKLKWFSDVTYSSDKNEYQKFLEFISQTDNYVVKFHSFDIKKYPNFLLEKIYANKSYNVKILRKDLVKQIASSYVASVRNLYHYDSTDTSEYLGNMGIDFKKIISSINRIKEANRGIEELKIQFDSTIYYEDHEYDNDICGRTPLPKNYQEITTIIEKLLNDFQ